MSRRPTVSVIVPFAGSGDDLLRVIAELERIEVRGGDELMIADNRSRSGSLSGAGGPVRVLAAGGIRAPGYARNQAARVAQGEWLVFIDADTIPSPGLLDAYFIELPGPRTGVLAGTILDRPGGSGVAARRSAGRAQMSQQATLGRRGSPYAQTANCAVRSAAFEAVGGFDAEARAGEDADLCFRLARAGWRLEARANASVEHPTRATLPALLAQLARHGSGAAWLDRRYPGEFPPPGPRELIGRPLRVLAGALVALARGRPAAAFDALLELLEAWAFDLGRMLSNRPPGA